jgi:hypothetical protein
MLLVSRSPEAVEAILPTPEERIVRSIHAVRDRQVMLDSDLADLYEAATRALNRAVKRNAERFPTDFIFRLTREEAESFEAPRWRLKTRGR